MKNLLIIALLSFAFLCTAQERFTNASDPSSEEKSAIIQTENNAPFDEKEWEKTKKEILRNKKKFSEDSDAVLVSRVIDTIYINIPSE
ncbi:hypothetical protein [Aquimarina pacifica]|uniref:hypothetical protein n=1 Tax=Aquimarina pacifica TaxID=1296415 RepID=UPI00046EF976|nr:hypothetical protein [Aquimarina pacifica]